MDAELYTDILRTTFIPFICEKFPYPIGSCRTMTRNTLRVVSNAFLMKITSLGGRLSQSLLTLTQSRICGMSLKNL